MRKEERGRACGEGVIWRGAVSCVSIGNLLRKRIGLNECVVDYLYLLLNHTSVVSNPRILIRRFESFG
jgi:hypothetical protein